MIQDDPRQATIATSDEIPFEAVTINIDHKKLRKLIQEISKGRNAKFHNVVISGGVWGESEINDGGKLISFGELLEDNDINYYIAGMFSEGRRDIRIYPESFLLRFIQNFTYQLDGMPQKKHVEKLRKEYSQNLAMTLLEELEHGHQDFMEWKYFWSQPDRRLKFFEESRQPILIAYVFYFAVLIATQQADNIPAILAGLMILIVPAILMFLNFKYSIRGFKTFEEYEIDRAEKEAKKVARDPQLLKLAEQVLQPRIKLGDEALLNILKLKQVALDSLDKLTGM